MSHFMPEGELLRRAAAHIAEKRQEQPERALVDIIDEASMHFNLSPLDSQALLRLFGSDEAAP